MYDLYLKCKFLLSVYFFILGLHKVLVSRHCNIYEDPSFVFLQQECYVGPIALYFLISIILDDHVPCKFYFFILRDW